MVAGCARRREGFGCLCRGLVSVCDEAEGFGSACAGCDDAEGAAGLGIVLATKGNIGNVRRNREVASTTAVAVCVCDKSTPTWTRRQQAVRSRRS